MTSPARSTSAPPDDAGARRGRGLEQAARGRAARRTATRLSVDATSPLLIHGDESPGLGAPTTHTVSPAFGARDANGAGHAERVRGPVVDPCPRRRWRAPSSTRSVVASRPTTRAVVHDAVGGGHVDLGRRFPIEPVAREDLARLRRTHTPEPRRSCRSRRARSTATTECATAIASACAVTIGALVGTAPRSDVVGRAADRADGAEHGERQDRARRRRRRASWSTSVCGRGDRGGRERRELARMQPEPIERVGERAGGRSRSSSSRTRSSLSSSGSPSP